VNCHRPLVADASTAAYKSRLEIQGAHPFACIVFAGEIMMFDKILHESHPRD
jgi:hypothetical protein